MVLAAEIVKAIWQEMVLTLRARFDAIIGNSDLAMTKSLDFHTIWKNMDFYLLHNGNIRWNFVAPRLVFPPLAPL